MGALSLAGQWTPPPNPPAQSLKRDGTEWEPSNSTGRSPLPLHAGRSLLGDLAHGVWAASPCPCRGRRFVAVLPSPGSSSELPKGGAAKSVPTLEATFERCHGTEVKEPCWLLKFRPICRSCCGEQTRRRFDCSECSVHDALCGFGPRCACCYFWLLDWPRRGGWLW